jgi:amidase
MTTHLWQRTAGDLARMIAGRQVTSAEVVDAHLLRIEAVNPRVNAVVRVLADEARAGALMADQAVARGEKLAPLHGVPCTVKENIDVAGLPTTWGVPALAGAIVPLDAPVVQRMREAGAILIGRTNLPNMGMSVSSDSTLYGITRNPWNSRRTAGGSSCGEAVALATGMSPMGLGNDLCGSLRNPANACGIASIRPSTGRVPHAGFVPREDSLLSVQLMLSQGPMARRVADVRLGLKVLMGAHPRDPWAISAPLIGTAPTQPIRVALVAAPPGGSCDPVVSAVVRRAGDALANSGYDVVEACPPRYEEVVAAWARLALGDFASVMERITPLLNESAKAFWIACKGDSPLLASVSEMSELLMLRHGLGRAWSQFMADHPLVLTPTWTQLPFEHGFDSATPAGAAATVEMLRPVQPANLLGLPSACVPAGRDSATGLPIGVLLTGLRFREDLCLDAAEVIESHCGLVTPIDPVV